MKKIIAASTLVSMLMSTTPALAMPTTSMELVTPGTSKTLVLPEAAANARVISLGETVDAQSGAVVEGFAYIHYTHTPEALPKFGKGGKGGPSGGSDQCYALMGATWKNTEDYLFDAANTRGLDETTLHALMATAVETWDSEVTFDVFGTEIAGIVDGADTVSTDGKNEVMFASIDSPGAIAVTIVWGIFRGNPAQRKIVEWDMVFDDTDYDWSAETAGVAGKMDFLNIAVHEVGHAAGIDHPSSTCIEETMHAYADFGETKKRDLNAGDILGINAAY